MFSNGHFITAAHIDAAKAVKRFDANIAIATGLVLSLPVMRTDIPTHRRAGIYTGDCDRMIRRTGDAFRIGFGTAEPWEAARDVAYHMSTGGNVRMQADRA
jgi:hypothetical protein